MEENNKKIEELKNHISEMEKVFDTDYMRGKNEVNDQLQANRQKKINELNGKLKEVEIEKLSKLEERKAELEEILKKKESLNKDKEQLEQAIYEISGENEIQGGKIVKTQEQVEYENDLGKINEELVSLEEYELQAKDVNLEIDQISNKYNLIDYSDRKMTLNEWRERAAFEIPYKDYKYNSNEKITLQDFYKKQVEEDWSDLLLYARMAPATREFFKKYFPNKVMEKSADFVDSCIKGLKDDIQKGRVDYKNQANLIWWMDTLESIPSVDHDIIKSYSIQLKEKQGDKNFDIDKLSNMQEKLELIKARAILGQEVDIADNKQEKNIIEEDKNSEIDYNNSEEKSNEQDVKDIPEEVKEEIKTNIHQMNKGDTSVKKEPTLKNKTNGIVVGDIDKAIKLSGKTFGTKIGDNIESVLQPINNKETSIAVYKQPNRFVSWIKEKFNNLKERFFVNNKLDATGQAWQDYIDEQEGTTASKKNKFIENITQKGKLQSKEQQAKTFEAVKKWEQKNEEEITQEEIEK